MGDGDGRTNFKTSVWIEDANGKKITTSELSPMPIWDAVPPNCKLKYKVETLSDGKGRSDKFQLDIQFTDYSTIFRVLDRVLDNLTKEQREMYEAGSKVMEDSVNKMVAQIILDEKSSSIKPFTLRFSTPMMMENWRVKLTFQMASFRI